MRKFLVCLVISAVIIIIVTSLLFAAGGTFWKGIGQVSAKSNRLKIYNKGEKIYLKGNVRLEKNKMIIRSYRAYIFEKKKYFEAKGNVRLKRNYEAGEYLEAMSKSLVYYVGKDRGLLKELELMRYYLPKEEVIITINGEEAEFFEKDKIIHIRNNVKIIRETTKSKEEITEDTIISMVVTADKASIYEKKNYFEAVGNVNLKRNYANGDFVDADAETMYFDNQEERGKMNNVHRIDYFVKKDTMIVTMKSDILEIDDKQRYVKAEGNVFVSKDKGEFEIDSNKSFYKEEQGYLVFSEEPVIKQVHEKGDAVYKGEKIYFYPKTNKLVLKKQVEVEFYPKRKLETN